MKLLALLGGVACAAVLFISPAQAEQLPRWEIGLGAAGITIPDYRGSDERRNYLLPFPYIAYRLDWLKADRYGVRAKLIDSDRVELNVSLGATPPVRSDRNHARVGMPGLKPMLEIGPSLDINLWRSLKRGMRLDLRLPLRAAATVSSQPEAAGWSFTPRLNVDIAKLGISDAAKEGWRLGLVAGPVFADHRQNAYFYSVSPQFALPNRGAYDARGGYSGMQFLASLSRRYGNAWVGAYARRDSLKGAVFEGSPLVKTSSYFSAGFAVTWTIGQSSEMIDIEEN